MKDELEDDDGNVDDAELIDGRAEDIYDLGYRQVPILPQNIIRFRKPQKRSFLIDHAI